VLLKVIKNKFFLFLEINYFNKKKKKKGP
jgi:hypothetical protein